MDARMTPVRVKDGTLPRFVAVDGVRTPPFCDVPTGVTGDYAEISPDPLAKSDAYTYAYRGQVYKWFADESRAEARDSRAVVLRPWTPDNCRRVGHWLVYDWVDGELLSERTDLLYDVLDWLRDDVWGDVLASETEKREWLWRFYVEKTLQRIAHRYDVETSLKVLALPWDYVLDRIVLSPTWHGDCSFENVVCTPDGFRIIDWRENLKGDVHYDLAKLLKSAYFDHRTVRNDGTWKPHLNADALASTLMQWCERVNIDWQYVLLVDALHALAMSGSHKGPLGDALYEWGREKLKKVERSQRDW